jgi:cobalt-zinc-cadmium resistance protein CzcA
MSLGGLAIAIGLMVDGSVVIVENTFHRLGQKHGKEKKGMMNVNSNFMKSFENLNESERKGFLKNNVIFNACKEVATPVLFGVGIIILVFLPLMTMQGMEGKMFSPSCFNYCDCLNHFFNTIFHIISCTLQFFPHGWLR